MNRTRTTDKLVIVRGRAILAVTLASLALSAVAQRQQPAPRSAPSAAQLVAQRDAQLVAAGRAAFRRTDADRDGRASRVEVDRRMPGIAARFREFDRDRDGSLSPEEFLDGYTTPE